MWFGWPWIQHLLRWSRKSVSKSKWRGTKTQFFWPCPEGRKLTMGKILPLGCKTAGGGFKCQGFLSVEILQSSLLIFKTLEKRWRQRIQQGRPSLLLFMLLVEVLHICGPLNNNPSQSSLLLTKRYQPQPQYIVQSARWYWRKQSHWSAIIHFYG